jgi:hypothetical protein
MQKREQISDSEQDKFLLKFAKLIVKLLLKFYYVR